MVGGAALSRGTGTDGTFMFSSFVCLKLILLKNRSVN